LNAFTGETGTARLKSDQIPIPIPQVARQWRDSGRPWVAVGDENYGEGSSREHAAMEPRHLGGLVVMVRSFARIHETNLKKQGVLPLVFADPAIYDQIVEGDAISILGLAELAPDTAVSCVLHHQADSDDVDFICTHTLTAEQIEWFRAGSALNLVRRRFAPESGAPATQG
ncbi:MAG: hypothetical protein ACRDRT_15690, partial [Pseudonocardiaceae bacterium]